MLCTQLYQGGQGVATLLDYSTDFLCWLQSMPSTIKTITRTVKAFLNVVAPAIESSFGSCGFHGGISLMGISFMGIFISMALGGFRRLSWSKIEKGHSFTGWERTVCKCSWWQLLWVLFSWDGLNTLISWWLSSKIFQESKVEGQSIFWTGFIILSLDSKEE